MKTLLRSFAAGEVAPELFGRVDLVKNQTGLALARNFITLPHGPAMNRGGLYFTTQTKYADRKARLIPFRFNVEQTYWLEFGHEYIRIITDDAVLVNTAQTITGIAFGTPTVVTYTGADPAEGAAVRLTVPGVSGLDGRFLCAVNVDAGANTFELETYSGAAVNVPSGTFTSGSFQPVIEVATPYQESELFDIHYTQSNDVLTLVHPNHPPRELQRSGATAWSLVTPSFEPSIAAPAGNPELTRVGSGTTRYRYRVTSLAEDGSESFASLAGVQTTATYTITNVTNADPAVFTMASLVSADDLFYISGLAYMGIPDGEYWTDTVLSSTTFTLRDINDVVVDTSAAAAFSTNGTMVFAGILNNLNTAGNSNTIRWAAVAGAEAYNVYKESNGIFGYIGQAVGLRFTDNNITADISNTPPIGESPFAAAGDYPSAVGYHDGRKWFAGTNNAPQTFWASRSGTENNMQYSRPTKDTDRISYKLNARESNAIKHIVPMGDLLMLTAGGEWRIDSQNTDVLTPNSVAPRAQSYVGASNVQPASTKIATLYAQDRGGRVMSIEYDDTRRGYVPVDKSVMAPHLFDYDYTIVDMGFSRAPIPVLWAVRDDGVLLGMTYLPEHDIYAWHQHTTDGLFESVAVAPRGIDDDAYFIVKRTINGQTVRYIERLTPRRFTTVEECFFVDAGLTYSGPAADTISGLWHLVGEEVSILADGGVHPTRTVAADGTITLDYEAELVHIGLPYTADLQTLPLAMETEAAFQGTRKNVSKVHVRLSRSSGVFAGPSADTLAELKQRGDEPMGDPPALLSGIYEIPIRGSWSDEGQVWLRQANPLPLMVSAIVLEVVSGG